MSCLPLLLWMLVRQEPSPGTPPHPPPPAQKAQPAKAQPDEARLREMLFARQQPVEQGQAALLLVQHGGPEAQTIVREGLRRWDRPDVVQALAQAVRVARDSRFVQPLLQGLAAEHGGIRSAMIESLAALESDVVIRWLLAVVEDAKAPMLARQSAVETLGRCQHKAAVRALLDLLKSESPAVRQSAADALAEVSGHAYGLDAAKWQAWWALQQDLSEEDWLKSRTALFAERARRLQGELQRAELDVLELHKTLYDKTPVTDKHAYLRKLASSDYVSVRLQVITWLAELLVDANQPEQQRLGELLLDLGNDTSEPVQRAAVLAMERVDDPQIFARLIQLLSAPAPTIRAAAARSLGRSRLWKNSNQQDVKTRVVRALEQALGDASAAVVANAAQSLGSLGIEDSAPQLAGLLMHDNELVRQAASSSLEQVAGQAELAQLLSRMTDPSAAVRFNLVGALGRIGTRANTEPAGYAEIIKRLERVLTQDIDPGVRSKAATVLGQIGGANELTVLWLRVRTSEDFRVQDRAWRAMLEIWFRNRDLALMQYWDHYLAEQKENARRIEMLTETRTRWLRDDRAQTQLDGVTSLLVRALLGDRKWPTAVPLITDLLKRPMTDTERRDRLQWLLVAGRQALDDQKPQEVLKMLKDTDALLINTKELAAEFSELRRRATVSAEK